jgi:hypothetical protein
MRVVCIGNVNALTIGKYYDVIQNGSNPNSNHLWYKDWFLLKNDNNDTLWYDRKTSGIIKILPLLDIWVKYIGDQTDGISYDSYYNLLDRGDNGDEYYYFLNDKNEFVGIRKINFFGGKNNFRIVDISEIRNEKINNLLNYNLN